MGAAAMSNATITVAPSEEVLSIGATSGDLTDGIDMLRGLAVSLLMRGDVRVATGEACLEHIKRNPRTRHALSVGISYKPFLTLVLPDSGSTYTEVSDMLDDMRDVVTYSFTTSRPGTVATVDSGAEVKVTGAREFLGVVHGKNA